MVLKNTCINSHRKETGAMFTPTYNMPVGSKCTYLNNSSLHKTIKNVNVNYKVHAADIFLAETNLKANESNSEYLIPEF